MGLPVFGAVFSVLGPAMLFLAQLSHVTVTDRALQLLGFENKFKISPSTVVAYRWISQGAAVIVFLHMPLLNCLLQMCFFVWSHSHNACLH